MIAPLVLPQQNRLMRRFRQAGAITPPSARPPQDVGCRNSWIFRRLVARGVFIEAKPGRYYINEVAADEFVRLRRARMLEEFAIALVLAALVVLTS